MPSSGFPFAIIQVQSYEKYVVTVLFWNIFLEPIGFSKPKFSSIVDLSAFKKELGSGIALTCPAQGIPIPAFR